MNHALCFVIYQQLRANMLSSYLMSMLGSLSNVISLWSHNVHGMIRYLVFVYIIHVILMREWCVKVQSNNVHK